MLDKNGKQLFRQMGIKKNIFEKLQIFFFQKMSHSAGQYKRGTLWGLLTYIL